MVPAKVVDTLSSILLNNSNSKNNDSLETLRLQFPFFRRVRFPNLSPARFLRLLGAVETLQVDDKALTNKLLPSFDAIPGLQRLKIHYPSASNLVALEKAASRNLRLLEVAEVVRGTGRLCFPQYTQRNRDLLLPSPQAPHFLPRAIHLVSSCYDGSGWTMRAFLLSSESIGGR